MFLSGHILSRASGTADGAGAPVGMGVTSPGGGGGEPPPGRIWGGMGAGMAGLNQTRILNQTRKQN